MQLTLEIPDGDNQRASMLKFLSQECDAKVISAAYVYALNLVHRGVDIDETWDTVVAKSQALGKAYAAGYSDAKNERS